MDSPRSDAPGRDKEFLLVRAEPCDVAFRASHVLQIGNPGDFPGLSLIDLASALAANGVPGSLEPSGDHAEAASATSARDAVAAGASSKVLVVGSGAARVGIAVSGHVSMVRAERMRRLSLPPLLRTHDSVVGLLAETTTPTAVLVDVPRLLLAWKGSS